LGTWSCLIGLFVHRLAHFEDPLNLLEMCLMPKTSEAGQEEGVPSEKPCDLVILTGGLEEGGQTKPAEKQPGYNEDNRYDHVVMFSWRNHVSFLAFLLN